MIGWLGYRYHLFRLQYKRAKATRGHIKVWNKAKAENKSDNDLGALALIHLQDMGRFEDERYELESHYLYTLAEKYLIPLPEPNLHDTENFQKTKDGSTYRLTNTAILKLRAAIRAEKKDRSELARSWLAGLTGLIGVLIGLVAIILGRR
jgi:hypothetical protein